MKCIVYPIKLYPHPTQHGLRVGVMGPNQSHQVVVGDHYADGTLGIFIPDGAIIPDKLAEEMWVKGRLAGKQKNRVKGRMFHDVRSDGLFYGSRFTIDGVEQTGKSWNPAWKEGDDVTAEIGVTFP